MSKLGMNPSSREKRTDGVLQAGDKLVDAFNQMRDELVSTLWYLLGNQEEAQDAAQEAFLRCWRVRENVEDIRNLRAWIYRIALNVARDVQRSAWYKRSKPMSNDNLVAVSGERGPEEAVERKESLDRLREAIMRLRQDEKEVFLLRQNGDLTFEQIAEVRRSPVGTVKTQMRSALQKLRQQLASA